MFEFIGALAAGVENAISSVCSTIGGTLLNAATSVVRFASTILEVGTKALGLNPLGILEVVSRVVSGIAEFLGLKNQEEDSPEELGLKMEQADKTMDDFSSIEEYINYLHNEIKLDREKMRSLSMEEKVAYSSVGWYTYLKGTSEKLNLKHPIGPELMMDCARLDMQPKEFVTYMEKMREANVENPADFSKYLHGQSESFETSQKVKVGMMSALREMNPGINDETAVQSILDMKDVLKN